MITLTIYAAALLASIWLGWSVGSYTVLCFADKIEPRQP